MGCFWIIVALIVLVSIENQFDRERITKITSSGKGTGDEQRGRSA